MRVVQRLGAVAVDAQDRSVAINILYRNGSDTQSFRLYSPREDVKIHKARTV